MIISLGGDANDSVEFTNADKFYSSEAELTAKQLEYIEAKNIDIESLHAYETDAGNVVWSDVDLLA